MRSKNWFNLDNSAKIFPSMTNNLNTNVFRLSIELNEDVDPLVLQRALDDAIIEYPLFSCELKSGLFWHYLEESNKRPLVKKENNNPCEKMNDGFLFRLSYYKKRINLEVYHVLSDGNGAMEFLKYVVASYLNKKYDIKDAVSINDSTVDEKNLDAFSKYENSSKKVKVNKNRKAYKIKMARRDSVTHSVIEAHMSAKEIKKQARECNTTVTIYLIALLIDSIIKCARVKDLKKPIGITVPIDLRKMYNSKTNRNFFYTVCIQYLYKEDYDLLDIIKRVSDELESRKTKSSIQGLLNSYMLLENMWIIRIIPVALKDFILGIFIKYTSSKETMTLSSMGVVDMPKEYEKYVNRVSAIMSSNDLHLTVVTYKDDMALSFTNHFISNEIQHSMIMSLKSRGVKKVSIVTNERE